MARAYRANINLKERRRNQPIQPTTQGGPKFAIKVGQSGLSKPAHAMEVIPAVRFSIEEFDAIVQPLTGTCEAVAEDELRALLDLAPEVRTTNLAGKPLITGCILARNEGDNIEGAIESLRLWTDEVLIIDNESEDATVQIARRCGARVISAPRSNNFDAARNLAIDEAISEFIFVADADERVPAGLGMILRRMVEDSGDSFEALQAPFKTYFCGQWIRHSGWWPGYTRCQLLKKGRLTYGTRLRRRRYMHLCPILTGTCRRAA